MLKDIRASLWVWLAVVAIVLGLRAFGALQQRELAVYDWLLNQLERPSATVADDRSFDAGDIDGLAQRHQLLETLVPDRPGARELVEPVDSRKDLVGTDPVEVQQTAIEDDLEQRPRTTPHLGIRDAIDGHHLGHDPLLGQLT